MPRAMTTDGDRPHPADGSVLPVTEAPQGSQVSSGASGKPTAGGAPARLRGHTRALVLEIAAEARAEWAYTSDVIARAFRSHRELGSGERRLASETIYGLVRWHRRLQAIVDDLVRGRGKKL